MQFNPTQFQKKGEQQHPYDAGRKLDIRKKNNQFTQSQASEKDSALTNHTTITYLCESVVETDSYLYKKELISTPDSRYLLLLNSTPFGWKGIKGTVTSLKLS